MRHDEKRNAKEDAANSITAWLLTLEIARIRGDFKQAAEAQRELAKHGVRVSYGRPKAVAHA